MILSVLEHIRIDRLLVLLFCKIIPFVRKSDVVDDIFIPGFRHKNTARQLRTILIRPLGDNLELLIDGIIIDLEITSVQISGLKGYMLD